LAPRDRSDDSNVGVGVTPQDDVDGGARGPAHERHYGSDVGGGGKTPGRIPGEEVGSTDPGLWNKNLGGERSSRGPDSAT